MQTEYQLKPEIIAKIKEHKNLDLRIKLIDYYRCYPSRISIIINDNDVRLTQYGALKIITEYFHFTNVEQIIQPVPVDNQNNQ